MIRPGLPGGVATLGWAALALVVGMALVRPLIPFDGWLYHLPFAAKLWDLPGAAAFGMEAQAVERWAGYPRAWHWLMGLAWWATDSLRAVIVPQLVLVGLFLAYLRRAHGIAPPLMALGLLASPMLLIHVQATYLDLPAGLCLALGFLVLLDMLAAARGPDGTVRRASAALAIAAIGLAGNIKYQGTLGAFLVLAIAGGMAAVMSRIAARRRLALLAVMAAAGLAASLSLVGNAIRYGQPLYPMDVKLLGLTVSAGPESPEEDANPPAYLLAGSQLVRLPGPWNC